MIEQRWSDLSALLVKYNRVDLFIVFRLPPFVPSIYACFWFVWPLVCFTEMPFPCITLGAAAGLGLVWRPPSRVVKPFGCDCPLPCGAKASTGLVIFLLPSLYLSCSFTHDCIVLVCQSLRMHIVSINPQDLLLGRPTFTLIHMNTLAHTAVFPSSRICSIFPHESCGIRPISFILPVSCCLALKRVWSLWDLLYHYSWTSLFCNCLRTFNEFPRRQTVGGL